VVHDKDTTDPVCVNAFWGLGWCGKS
jgi:hypothetical protein